MVGVGRGFARLLIVGLGGAVFWLTGAVFRRRGTVFRRRGVEFALTLCPTGIERTVAVFSADIIGAESAVVRLAALRLSADLARAELTGLFGISGIRIVGLGVRILSHGSPLR